MEVLEQGVGGGGNCCVYRDVKGAGTSHNSDSTLKELCLFGQKGVAG